MALDPSRPDAIREMERGVHEFGFRGIKLYPIMSVYNPADPAFHPFYRRARGTGPAGDDAHGRLAGQPGAAQVLAPAPGG